MGYVAEINSFFIDTFGVNLGEERIYEMISDSERLANEDNFLVDLNENQKNFMSDYFPYKFPKHFYNFAIENLLRNRIQELPEDTNYIGIIKKYFHKLHKSSGYFYMDFDINKLDEFITNMDNNPLITNEDKIKYLPDEEKYKLVLDTISKMWVSSEKNPSIFENSSDFEPILQRNIQYRDHLIHSYNVFLIGYYIINKLYEIDSSLFISNRQNTNLTWMLASTFHDIAYPIQEIESWSNDMIKTFFGTNPNFQFRINELMPPIYIDFMRLLSIFNKEPFQSLESINFRNIDWTIYDSINTELIEKKEHGVIGALILSHLLAVRQKFSEGGEWDFLYSHLPASHAICLHHLSYIPVQFRKHPFAFLLSIIDEIQDWGRPSSRKDIDDFYLIDLKIVNEEKPKIEFTLNISTEKEEKLQQILSKERFSANGKIIISIKNLEHEIICIDN